MTWVSSWYDPGKESAAANTMINMGADVITQHTDSPGPINAAEKKGVFAIGYHTDMSVYGEKAHLTAIEHNWGHYMLLKQSQYLMALGNRRMCGEVWVKMHWV